jgi:hypothetical protein
LKWTKEARRAYMSWRGEEARPRSVSTKPGEEAVEEILFSAARREAVSSDSDCSNQHDDANLSRTIP